jgi:type II secretory pathway component GspD/PulD (secretin)
MTMRSFAGLFAGLVLLTQLAAAPFVTAQMQRDRAIKRLMKQFAALYKEGRYHEAEEVAQKAQEIDPKNKRIAAAVHFAGRLVLAREHQQGRQRIAEAEKTLLRHLDSPVSVNFENATLKQVIDDIREFHGINIVPDLPALHEAGVSLESPVSIKLDKEPLRTVLNLVLGQVKLAWVIKDEVVNITTEECARGKLTTVASPVADLVVPISPVVGQGKPSKPVATTEQKLIKLITSTIAPHTWSQNGGRGTIDYFPMTMSVVINQSPDIQEQVLDLLDSLRRLQDRQVCVELRFVTISDEHFKKLGLGKRHGRCRGTLPDMLDDAQVQRLLEAVQNDRSANVMQAPKLTCFSGQKATINVTDKQAFVTGIDFGSVADGGPRPIKTVVEKGIVATIEPTIEDGKRVSMNLDFRITCPSADRVPEHAIVCTVCPNETCEPTVYTQYLQRPRFTVFAGQSELALADGKTAVLSGWSQLREVRRDFSPAVLKEVPGLGHLFRQVVTMTEKEHLLVLVTTRVIEEKEESTPTGR